MHRDARYHNHTNVILCSNNHTYSFLFTSIFTINLTYARYESNVLFLHCIFFWKLSPFNVWNFKMNLNEKLNLKWLKHTLEINLFNSFKRHPRLFQISHSNDSTNRIVFAKAEMFCFFLNIKSLIWKQINIVFLSTLFLLVVQVLEQVTVLFFLCSLNVGTALHFTEPVWTNLNLNLCDINLNCVCLKFKYIFCRIREGVKRDCFYLFIFFFNFEQKSFRASTSEWMCYDTDGTTVPSMPF